MMKVIVALAFVLISTSSAQKCKCLPKQFSAQIGSTTGQTINGKGQGFEAYGTMSVDFDKKMRGIKQTLIFEGYQLQQKAVHDLTKGELLIGQQGKCLRYPFPSMEQCPKDIEFLGAFAYGTKGELPIEAFRGKYKPSGKFTGSGSFTTSLETTSCTPVNTNMAMAYSVEGTMINQMTTMSYVNTTLTIPDPSIFDIPAECK